MSDARPAPDDDCAKALARLCEFLDNELDSADADEVRAHLAACEPCMDTFDAEDALKRLVKRGCGDVRAPEHVRVRVMSVFTQHTEVRSELWDR